MSPTRNLFSVTMIGTVRRIIRFVRYLSAYGINNTIIYIVYVINKCSEQSVGAVDMDSPTVKHCSLSDVKDW